MMKTLKPRLPGKRLKKNSPPLLSLEVRPETGPPKPYLMGDVPWWDAL
jgi:hypothetical protein